MFLRKSIIFQIKILKDKKSFKKQNLLKINLLKIDLQKHNNLQTFKAQGNTTFEVKLFKHLNRANYEKKITNIPDSNICNVAFTK